MTIFLQIELKIFLPKTFPRPKKHYFLILIVSWKSFREYHVHYTSFLSVKKGKKGNKIYI